MSDLDKEFDKEIDLSSEFDNELDLDLEAEFDAEESLDIPISFSEGEGLVELESDKDYTSEKDKVKAEMSGDEAGLIGISEGATLGADRLAAGATRAGLSTIEDYVPLDKMAAYFSGDDQSEANIKEYEKMKEELGIEETGGDTSLLDEYYAGRDAAAQRSKQAFKERPFTTMGGNVLGGMASGTLIEKGIAKAGAKLPDLMKKFTKLKDIDKAANPEKFAQMQKLQKIADRTGRAFKGDDAIQITNIGEATELGRMSTVGKDMKKYIDLQDNLKKLKAGNRLIKNTAEGVTIGGIAGGTMGDAKLLEGEVAQTTKDILKGGIIGGTLASALTKGGQVFSSFIDDFTTLRYTKKAGQEAFEGRPIKEIKDEMDSAEIDGHILMDETKNLVQKLNKTKDNALAKMDELGITINVVDDIKMAKQEIMDKLTGPERGEVIAFLDTLDAYMNNARLIQKSKEKLRKHMIKRKLRQPLDEASAKLESRSMKRTLRKNQRPEEVQETNIFSDDMDLDMNNREALIRQETYKAKDEFGNEIKRKVKDIEDVTEFRPTPIKEEISPEGHIVHSYMDESTGKVYSNIIDAKELSDLDASKLTSEQLLELKDKLNNYSYLSKNGSIDPNVRKVATKSAVAVDKKLKQALGTVDKDIKETYKEISSLMEALDSAGITKKSGISREMRSDLEIGEFTDFITGRGDGASDIKFRMFMKRLKKVDPEAFKKFSFKIKDIRERLDIAGVTESFAETSGSARAALGGPGVLIRTGSKAGSMAKGVKDFVNLGTEPLKFLLKRVGMKKEGTMFSKQLEKAINSNENKRRGILYGLIQNPAFRLAFGSDINELAKKHNLDKILGEDEKK